MHGAGIIEAIEEKEGSRRETEYYVIRLPLGGMRVMVPIRMLLPLGSAKLYPKKT